MQFIITTISTTFIVLSAIMVAIGVWHVKNKRIEKHEKAMFIGGIFAAIFFIIYVSRTAILGSTSFAGPDNIKLYYTIFLISHIILSTTGGVLGLISLTTGFKKKLKKHRKLGPITSTVWFFTAITGVMVYLLLYIIYPGGETTNVIRAIFGT